MTLGKKERQGSRERLIYYGTSKTGQRWVFIFATLLGCTCLCFYNNSQLLQILCVWSNDSAIDDVSDHAPPPLAFKKLTDHQKHVNQSRHRDRHLDDTRQKVLRAAEEKVRLKFPGAMACRGNSDGSFSNYYKDSCSSQGLWSQENATSRILLYNAFHQPRYVCGRLIPAEDTIITDGDAAMRDCFRRSHPFFGVELNSQLFPIMPSRQTTNLLPPIEIWDSLKFKSPVQFHHCDVPCYASPEDGNLQFKTIGGTIWTLVWSMEGSIYYDNLRIDPRAHVYSRFYATTSFQSEIPLPYFSFAEYSRWQDAEPVSYDTAIHGAVFVARNCASLNNREDVVKGLMRSKRIRVDSVSSCLKNHRLPKGEKEDILRRYLFYLAFENQSEDDYITEKIWGAFVAGVLPVYLGGNNIHEHVPPHSIINVKDFNSTSDLAEYLHQVASNRTLYESYHAWRQRPLPTSFVAKYNFTRTHSICRTCRWALAKLYGLGWHHEAQEIRDPHISRQACFQSGRLVQPFRESWFSPISQKSLMVTEPIDDPVVCLDPVNGSSVGNSLALSGDNIRRTALSRDGVIDFFVEPTDTAIGIQNGGIVLQLETQIGMSNDEEILIRRGGHEYWLQDESSRVTLLTSQDSIVVVVKRQDWTQDRAMLQLYIQDSSIPFRLRLITEDIDKFYENGKNETQYFARLMTEDFWNPIESFLLPWNEGKEWEVALNLTSPRESTKGRRRNRKMSREALEQRRVNVIKSRPRREKPNK